MLHVRGTESGSASDELCVVDRVALYGNSAVEKMEKPKINEQNKSKIQYTASSEQASRILRLSV